MATLRAMEVVARRKMKRVKPIPLPPVEAGTGAGDDFFVPFETTSAVFCTGAAAEAEEEDAAFFFAIFCCLTTASGPLISVTI